MVLTIVNNANYKKNYKNIYNLQKPQAQHFIILELQKNCFRDIEKLENNTSTDLSIVYECTF